MARSAEQYLRFGLENPRDYRVIFMGGADEFAAVAAVGKPVEGEPTFQFLIDRVRECMQAGVLREGDPHAVATIIWAHVHGLVSLRLSGHLARAGTDAEFARFYAEATERLLAGLGP
jgi:hypothetical protein